jgi:hypothetical protein
MTSLLIVLAEVVHAYRSASWDMPPSWAPSIRFNSFKLIHFYCFIE